MDTLQHKFLIFIFFLFSFLISATPMFDGLWYSDFASDENQRSLIYIHKIYNDEYLIMMMRPQPLYDPLFTYAEYGFIEDNLLVVYHEGESFLFQYDKERNSLWYYWNHLHNGEEFYRFGEVSPDENSEITVESMRATIEQWIEEEKNKE